MTIKCQNSFLVGQIAFIIIAWTSQRTFFLEMMKLEGLELSYDCRGFSKPGKGIPYARF